MNKDVITMYKELHQIPELDKDLPLTIAYIRNILEMLSCTIIEPAPSSICAFFDFHKLTSLAFRSDMDALPITETNESAYVSQHGGCMHACGHDGHMAMLLDFAHELSELKQCDYNVLLIFQPAEETSGGAQTICQSGILEQFHTRAVFGIHLWPGLASGTFASKAGVLMARSSEIHLHIHGKRSHIASYKKGIDSLRCAVSLLEELYQKFPPTDQSLLKFGYLQSGDTGNCISSYTLIKGSLRTFDDALHAQIRSQIFNITQRIEAQTGCHVQCHFTEGYPVLCNHPHLFETAAISLPLINLTSPCLLTDDFSFYTSRLPGLYFFLGTGNDIPLHSDHFVFDEQTLQSGVHLYKKLLQINWSQKTDS